MTETQRMKTFDDVFGFAFPEGTSKKLQEMNFFSAPASTKFHLSYDGGLFEHSLNVALELYDLTQKLGLVWQRETSPFIVGFLHDLCKCDLYLPNDKGKYDYNLDADQRHGAKSVEWAKKIIDLNDEEIACIRYHMGSFKVEDIKEYTAAVKKYENVLWTHAADMYSSQVTENEQNNTD